MSSQRLLCQLPSNEKTTKKNSHCKENRGQHTVNDPTSCRRNTRIEIHKRCPLPTRTARVGRYCVKSGVLGEIEGEAHNMPRRLRRRLGGPGRRIRCAIAQGGSDRECSINVTGENQNGGNWVDRMVVCLGYRRCDLVYGVCGGSCRERLAAHKRHLSGIVQGPKCRPQSFQCLLDNRSVEKGRAV